MTQALPGFAQPVASRTEHNKDYYEEDPYKNKDLIALIA